MAKKKKPTLSLVGEEPFLPPGNWHAIEGPNGICACGPAEGCPERLRRWMWRQLDFWHAKANFLEREREAMVSELPDAWQRTNGSLAAKVAAFRDFTNSERDRFRTELASLTEAREGLRALLAETPHDVGCHPSEGVHTERCLRVKAALVSLKGTPDQPVSVDAVAQGDDVL